MVMARFLARVLLVACLVAPPVISFIVYPNTTLAGYRLQEDKKPCACKTKCLVEKWCTAVAITAEGGSVSTCLYSDDVPPELEPGVPNYETYVHAEALITTSASAVKQTTTPPSRTTTPPSETTTPPSEITTLPSGTTTSKRTAGTQATSPLTETTTGNIAESSETVSEKDASTSHPTTSVLSTVHQTTTKAATTMTTTGGTATTTTTTTTTLTTTIPTTTTPTTTTPMTTTPTTTTPTTTNPTTTTPTTTTLTTTTPTTTTPMTTTPTTTTSTTTTPTTTTSTTTTPTTTTSTTTTPTTTTSTTTTKGEPADLFHSYNHASNGSPSMQKNACGESTAVLGMIRTAADFDYVIGQLQESVWLSLRGDQTPVAWEDGTLLSDTVMKDYLPTTTGMTGPCVVLEPQGTAYYTTCTAGGNTFYALCMFV